MEIKCPECKTNKHIILSGKRQNKVEAKQRYRCKRCSSWFVLKDAFFKRKY